MTPRHHELPTLACGLSVPQLISPGSAATWRAQRLSLRRRLWRLLGDLPPRARPPAVEVLAREDLGDVWLERFEFDNGAGAKVPGLVFLPKCQAHPLPGVLYCHWHGGEYEIGKSELLHDEHTPEAPGPTLARRGYVVLGVDAYCFGERNGRGPGSDETGAAGEWTASKLNLWAGRTLWGMILRDDLMALDYLATRPEVDATRLGATGISMGATRSWWLMALDDRIRTAVAVGCLTRYQDLITRGELRQHGIYYYVPGMLKYFDTEAVVALAAPRPILFQTGDQDAGSPVEGIRAIEAGVRPIYELYGAEQAFQSLIYPGAGHVYLPEMWERTKAWLDEKLNRP